MPKHKPQYYIKIRKKINQKLIDENKLKKMDIELIKDNLTSNLEINLS